LWLLKKLLSESHAANQSAQKEKGTREKSPERHAMYTESDQL